MKAILLAGGEGTRLRPLTIHTPKPVVPIFGRPVLSYQLDLLRRVAEIDEVILSLNYQPALIEQAIGEVSAPGFRIRYLVEPQPLGTGGAIKYAASDLDGSVVVFNGDVLTGVDVAEVVQLHRERKARATIVLAPVENPLIYGLVETDHHQNVTRFIEKPNPNDVSCNTINAGIYVLDSATFDRIPTDTAWSIERKYFPSLVERGDPFVAYIHSGYWIDIGTPAKYLQVHRDIMDGRFVAPPFSNAGDRTRVSPKASIHPKASLEAPCFVDAGATVGAGARIGPYSVLGLHCTIEEQADIEGSVLWPGCQVGRNASVRGAIVGRDGRIGQYAVLRPGVVLGDSSSVADYSHV